jgi:phosphoglycolate phosphatase-like HAD superfamily hydrolase
MVKTIVFDFDGVIVDSNALKRDVWNFVFNDRDEWVNEILQKNVDMKIGDRFDILEKTFINLGERQENVPALIRHYTDRYNLLIKEGILKTSAFPRIHEILGNLSLKYSLYINSVTPEKPLKETVEVLGIVKYFREIFGSTATKEDNLKKVLSLEFLAPQNLLMVGDGEIDALTAAAVGAKFIGITNEFNSWKDTSFPLLPDLIMLEETIKSL